MRASILIALSLLTPSCGHSAGQKLGASPSVTQQVLSLNRENDGQHVSAKLGQRIVVTLQTIGGGQYGTPQLSSSAIRFAGAVFAAKQNPGGPTQVYNFTATAEGEAQIRIPHTDSNPTVTFTIQVKNGDRLVAIVAVNYHDMPKRWQRCCDAPTRFLLLG